MVAIEYSFVRINNQEHRSRSRKDRFKGLGFEIVRQFKLSLTMKDCLRIIGCSAKNVILG